jgi:hypothetical protein
MRRGILAVAIALFASVVPAATATETSRLFQPGVGLTPISHDLEASSNWSGYSADRTGTTFTRVTGSWVQPSSTCVKNKFQAAAFFTGIDGDNSPSVEQIGTDADCVQGAPVSYAWYEMYPAPSHTITDCVIEPGDLMTGTVQWNASTQDFTLKLTDDGAGGGHCGNSGTYSTTVAAPGPTARSSAEWITESPATGGHFWPLTNFGTAAFSSGSATTDGGHSGLIADTNAWDTHQIIMATVVGSPSAPKIKDVRANPQSSLVGGSFNVTWNNP